MRKLLLVSVAFLSLGCLYSLRAQEEAVYRFFQEEIDFPFLKGIEAKIDSAGECRDAKSLCVYAAALFYSEHVSGQVHPEIDGIGTLRKATLIAWQDKDAGALSIARAMWASELFGPNNPSAAEAIDRFIEELAKEAKPSQESLPDPQAFLMAEEEARLDALRQVAEQIFGVMVESVTDVKEFSTQRDVVVARLKSGLMLGARFGNTEIRGDEVYVPVTVSRQAVIVSMEQALLSRGKRMSETERSRLEKTLNAKYRAVGAGTVSDR